MFSHSYNYLFFFFNYELLVLVCFVLFLFFAFIMESGAIGSYLQELSIQARSKMIQNLVKREELIKELINSLERNISRSKIVLISLLSISEDIIVIFQQRCKVLTRNREINRVKYYLDNLILKSEILTNGIRLYLTRELFSEKSFYIKPQGISLKKIKL